MKTYEDVVALFGRIIDGKEEDILGFKQEVLLSYLEWKDIEPHVKEGVTRDNFCGDEGFEDPVPFCYECVFDDMKQYMKFAIGKVINHRGISASRSIEKMRIWLWILGDDEAIEFLNNDSNYENYGAPMLKFICEKYDLWMPDESESQGFHRMAKGLPCRDDCDMGCGK